MNKELDEMNVKHVDILIPTRDRAMQLHLLLESMSKHLKGMGRVTISWEGSDDDFIAGYELLKKRIMNDAAFSALRKNSREIIFKQRNSLREVYDAAINSGDSDFIMPLIDDDVFFRDYHLVNDETSKHFFVDPSILACSLRLGDNLSNQLPSTLADGLILDVPVGHATSLLSTAKPRYIQVQYSHELKNTKEADESDIRYLKWAWPDNLNVPHWSTVWSTTSQIYRKTEYMKLLETIGRDNFLLIEKDGKTAQVNEFLQLSETLFKVICFIDKLQSRFFKRFGIYEQDVFQIILAKMLYRKRLKKKFMYLIHMVSPEESVVVNLDAGVSHHREGGFGEDIVKLFNKNYLAGQIVSLAAIPFENIRYPRHLFTSFDFVPFT